MGAEAKFKKFNRRVGDKHQRIYDNRQQQRNKAAPQPEQQQEEKQLSEEEAEQKRQAEVRAVIVSFATKLALVAPFVWDQRSKAKWSKMRSTGEVALQNEQGQLLPLPPADEKKPQEQKQQQKPKAGKMKLVLIDPLGNHTVLPRNYKPCIFANCTSCALIGGRPLCRMHDELMGMLHFGSEACQQADCPNVRVQLDPHVPDSDCFCATHLSLASAPSWAAAASVRDISASVMDVDTVLAPATAAPAAPQQEQSQPAVVVVGVDSADDSEMIDIVAI